MGNIDITVIVCTYNREKMILDVLNKLSSQDTDGEFTYEILVIDNGSTDETWEILIKGSFEGRVPFRIIKESLPGLANARNRGVKEARGEWIACFDDDVMAETTWLKELLKVALLKGCDCVAGRSIVDLPEPIYSKLGPGCRGLLGESDWGDEARKLSGKKYPSDFNILRNRRVFRAIGEFDTNMVRGGQDKEFSKRVFAAGFNTWYTPNALVYHHVPSHRIETKYLRWASFRHGYNAVYTDHKHGGLARIVICWVARLGQAMLVHLPCLIFSLIRRDKGEILWRRSLLWRAIGYTRSCLLFFVPKLFQQKSFFDELEFRKERESFGTSI